MNNRLDSLKKRHIELSEEIDELKLKNTNWLQTIKALKNSLEELKIRHINQTSENKESLEEVEKYCSVSCACQVLIFVCKFFCLFFF